ncbi:nucleoside phosphorylase [Azospirillum sp. BE72]|nr:nucleoside phosphorylase [Azospirillum sp. BE72]
MAVLRHLANPQQVMRRGSLFHVGRLSCGADDWSVAVGETGAGNSTAALVTERAITEFEPEVALFVGIAGGVKDVSIGDVVIASGVYRYESGKVEENRFLVRPHELHSSTTLSSLAGGLAHDAAWRARLKVRRIEGKPEIFLGRVAAGEKLVASAKSELCRFLREHYNDAIAVEMEGYGFLDAVNHNEEVRGLVVRGISDLLDDKAATDARGSQDIAADSAAAVAFEILARMTSLGVRPKVSPVSPPPAVQIGEVGPGRFVWSGAVPLTEAGRLWSRPSSISVMRIGVPHGCSPALRHALLRLLCHAPEDAFDVEILDCSDWLTDYRRCLKEMLPSCRDQAVFRRLRPPTTLPAAGSGEPLTADDLAQRIELVLDACTMRWLDEGVQGVLDGREPLHGCFVEVDPALAARLRTVWEAWKDGMNTQTRRHFFEMLAAVHDAGGHPQAGIGIGQQTVRDCMVPATILALAVAECGDAIMHPTGDGPLKPHGAAPGNLASPTLRGHSSGAQRVKGKPIEHWIDTLTHLPWQCRIVMLGGLRSSRQLTQLRQQLIGRVAPSGRLTDSSLARPITLTFDEAFAQALAGGIHDVESHLRTVLHDLRDEQAKYLLTVSPPAPTKQLVHEPS